MKQNELIPDYGFEFFYQSRKANGDLAQWMINSAAKRAVSLAHYGTVCRADAVRKELGCEKDGRPVYSLEDKGGSHDYIVGKTKEVPEGAMTVRGTPLWVMKVR